MPLLRCPTCGKSFDKAQSTAMPFCCARCKQIDLGRWLGEGYSLPVDPLDEEEPDERYDSDSAEND